MDNDDEIEFVDEPLYEVLAVPGSRKRRRVAANVAPVVAGKRRAKGKKRGHGIRVAIRNKLKLQRRKLRLSHNAAKKAYRIRYRKLTQGIRQLTSRKAGASGMRDV